MKKWQVMGTCKVKSEKYNVFDIVDVLLRNRGLTKKKDIENFLNPPDPNALTTKDVGIDSASLKQGITRIKRAIEEKESIVVYADYDADGITAAAIMWETLHKLGAQVMPYIPHRADEGYGLSIKGIDTVVDQYQPALIVTVDHGITAHEKVAYAKTKSIDVIVTDHHVKPKKLPDCTIIHTTDLCGAGVSWFVCKELFTNFELQITNYELLPLAAIGTIADMVPLVGANRSIVKYGLAALNKTERVGLLALIEESGLTLGELHTYDVSHVLAPRLNAMGRLVHAMDALRLLCTKQQDKTMLLARKLGSTNVERQKLTEDSVLHARDLFLKSPKPPKNLIFIFHENYNQGVIGLVAGKLVEEFYRPTVVLSKGELVSKASARSIPGFNIVEAIRACSDILVDVGGHPMAAGFTVETKNLSVLQERLEAIAEKELDEEKLMRTLRIDAEIPLQLATEQLWTALCDFEPFGMGNPEPVFATRGVSIKDVRVVGNGNKHLKLHITDDRLRIPIDAIAFNLGSLYGKLKPDAPIDIAYTIDMNEWNGNRKLQLKIKDIRGII